jgi:selenophosphate synthase
MTAGSRVRAQISVGSIPVLPFVKEMVLRDVIPGGTDSNREFVLPHVLWTSKSPPLSR